MRSEILSVTLLGCGLGCSEHSAPAATPIEPSSAAPTVSRPTTADLSVTGTRANTAAATLDLCLSVEGGTVATFQGGEPVLVQIALRRRPLQGQPAPRPDLPAIVACATVRFFELDANGDARPSALSFARAKSRPNVFLAGPTDALLSRGVTLVAALTSPEIDGEVTSNPVLLQFGLEAWPGIDATPEHGLLRVARFALASGDIDGAREILVKLAASTKLRAEALRFAADFFRQTGRTASACEADRLLLLHRATELKTRSVPTDHEPELPLLPPPASSPDLGDPLLTLLSRR